MIIIVRFIGSEQLVRMFEFRISARNLPKNWIHLTHGHVVCMYVQLRNGDWGFVGSTNVSRSPSPTFSQPIDFYPPEIPHSKVPDGASDLQARLNNLFKSSRCSISGTIIATRISSTLRRTRANQIRVIIIFSRFRLVVCFTKNSDFAKLDTSHPEFWSAANCPVTFVGEGTISISSLQVSKKVAHFTSQLGHYMVDKNIALGRKQSHLYIEVTEMAERSGAASRLSVGSYSDMCRSPNYCVIFGNSAPEDALYGSSTDMVVEYLNPREPPSVLWSPPTATRGLSRSTFRRRADPSLTAVRATSSQIWFPTITLILWGSLYGC